MKSSQERWSFSLDLQADHDTEDERDGRFTCEVCGRSQYVLLSTC